MMTNNNNTNTQQTTTTTMTLEEAAKALRAKLSNLPEVWSVGIAETTDAILVYTTTAKVWVDLPPVFPKGPEGYTVHMVVSRPPRAIPASPRTHGK